MTGRVTSQLLLVGSLPSGSTESAFRDGAALFSDLVCALPDGETGPRSAWVGFDRTMLLEPHPDIEILAPTSSPTGRARHTYETARLTVRDGIESLRFDTWPRVPPILDSYRTFTRLRAEGAIPGDVRFQINFPFPSSVFTGAFKDHYARDWEIVGPALEDLTLRALDEVLAEIPADELALQWDLAYEVLDAEQILGWTEGGPESAWERFAGPWSRIAPCVPEEVLMGLHLCYGTFPDWPMFEARDMGLIVRMANHAAATASRTLDWVHLAGPRYLRSDDDAFFAPLDDLDVGDARVFLGIVLPIDGADGLRRRRATASRHLNEFGVAMYCGFGRQPGQDPAATLREHSEVVRAVLR
ncbi:MAG: hypothetical protein M3235_19530 [Actinomycetota bacterium]|nr:hypothetical protein [Actinomycetota bacterium]